MLDLAFVVRKNAILHWPTFCAGAIAFSRSQFGEDDGPIFLDNLVCSSEDKSLLKCSKLSPVGVFSCDRSETAGARCYGIYIVIFGYCLCTESYIIADANECVLNTDGCAHNCSNTIGSYMCSCETGYSLDDDDHGCTGNTTINHSIGSIMVTNGLTCMSFIRYQ